jgi:hypothetical protein
MSATTFVTLSISDERQFLTIIQLVLTLHECVDPAPAESATEPLQSVADSATADPVVIDSAIVVEPLYSTADLAGSGAALTETFCICVRV